MAANPIIQAIGSSSGAGLPGIDKTDLVAGEVVTIVDSESGNFGQSYQWYLDETPLDSVISLVNGGTSSPSFVVPADASLLSGTILLRGVVNGVYSTSIRISLPMPNTGTRIPHYGEESEANDNGNTKGWHKSQTEWMRAANRRLAYILTADPTTAGGVEAPIGSIAQRDNTGVGELWQKIGVANDAWALVGGSTGVSNLQEAYDGGPAIVTGAGGPVTISRTLDDGLDVLSIAKSPALMNTGSALVISMSANTSSPALAITSGGTGDAISVSPNTNQSFVLGRALLDSRVDDGVYLSHYDYPGTTQAALEHLATGELRLRTQTFGRLMSGTATSFLWDGGILRGGTANSGGIRNSVASDTNPSLVTQYGITDTGVGGSTGEIAIITGALRAALFDASQNTVLTKKLAINSTAIQADHLHIDGQAATNIRGIRMTNMGAGTSGIRIDHPSTSFLAIGDRGASGIVNALSSTNRALGYFTNGDAYTAGVPSHQFGHSNGDNVLMRLTGAYTGGGQTADVLHVRNEYTAQNEYVGIRVLNDTAAIADITPPDGQQNSPMFVFEGQGWKTDATAASQQALFAQQLLVTQGAANPTSALVFKSNINAAGYLETLRVTSDGRVLLQDDGAVSTESSLGFASDATNIAGLRRNFANGNVSLMSASGDSLLFGMANVTVAQVDSNLAFGGTRPGTEALPFYYLNSDVDTGIWSPGANIYAISTGAVEAIRWNASQQTLVPDGSQAAPSYSFVNATNYGMFAAPGSTYLRFAANGSIPLTLSPVQGLWHVPFKIAESTAAIADSAGYGQIWVKDDANQTLYFTDDLGVDHPIGGALGPGSLDAAYDFGGAGAGRTITADSGAVVINNTADDTTNGLEITKDPTVARAASTLKLNMGNWATGPAIWITKVGPQNMDVGIQVDEGVVRAGSGASSALPHYSFVQDVDSGLWWENSTTRMGISGAEKQRWTSVGTTIYDRTTLAPVAKTSGATADLVYTAPAHTGQTASTESPSVLFDMSATKTWATGAITDQHALKILAPTYAFPAASVITEAATVFIDGPPVAGTNATITRSAALQIDSGVLRLPVGSLAAPSLSFNTVTGHGIYAISSSGTYFAVSNEVRMFINNGGQTYLYPDFSPTTPFLAVGTDTDTGLGYFAANEFGIITGALEAARWDASQNTILAGDIYLGLDQRIYFDDDFDTFMYANSDDSLWIYSGGAALVRFLSNGIFTYGAYTASRDVGTGTTSSLHKGLRIVNNVAATDPGARDKYSPIIEFQASAWDDTAGLARAPNMYLQLRTTAGTAVDSQLNFRGTRDGVTTTEFGYIKSGLTSTDGHLNFGYYEARSGGASDPRLQAGTVDPSAASGIAAPEGSVFLRHVTAAGEVWFKDGTADTAWTMVGADHPDPHLLAYGSAAAPAYSYSSDASLGIYGSTNFLGFSVLGVSRLDLSQTVMNVKVSSTRIGGGSAASPGLSFYTATDADTGLFRAAENELGVTTGGTEAIRWNASQQTLLPATTSTVPSLTFAADTTTGVRGAAGNLYFLTSATQRLRILNTGDAYVSVDWHPNATATYALGNTGRAWTDVVTGDLTLAEKAAATANVAGFGRLWVDNLAAQTLYFTDDAGVDFAIGGDLAGGGAHPDPHQLTNGAVGAPAYSFAAGTNYGMYYDGSTGLRFSAGGTNSLLVTANGAYAGINGTALLPSIARSNDPNTGMFWEGSGDILAISTGGTEAVRWNASQQTLAADGLVTAPAYSFQSAQTMGMYANGAILEFAQAGALSVSISSNQFRLYEDLVPGSSNVYNNGLDARRWIGYYGHFVDLAPTAAGAGTPVPIIKAVGPAHTSLTNAELQQVLIDLSASVQFDGVADSLATTFAAQRSVVISAPTFTSLAISADPETYPNTTIIDQGASLYVDGAPSGGTRTNIKERFAAWFDQVNTGDDGILVQTSTVDGPEALTIRNTAAATASLSKATNFLTFQSQGWNNTSVQSEWAAAGFHFQAVEEASNEPSGYFEFFAKSLGATNPWDMGNMSTGTSMGRYTTDGQWLVPDGTAAAPSYGFSATAGIGMYGTSTALRFSVASAYRMSLTSSQILYNFSTSSTVPKIGWASTPGTGIGNPATNEVSIITNSLAAMSWTSSQRTSIAIQGTQALPALIFGTDTDTGIFQAAANQIDFAAAGGSGANMSMRDGENFSWVQMRFLGGTAASPAMSHESASDVGVFFPTTATVAISTAGTEVMRWSGNQTHVAVGGSIGVPAIALGSDTDTGIYWGGTNVLGFSTGGKEQLLLTNLTATTFKAEFTGQVGSKLGTLSAASASIATDCNVANNFTVTLTTAGPYTLANPTNPISGFTYSWRIQQDATGSRGLSFGTNFHFPGGTAPTVSTAANAVDLITAVYDGTNFLTTFQADFQ